MQNPGKSVFDLDANLVALLCYLGNIVCALGLILSIITVVQEKTNKLARFHAFQSIFLTVFGAILGVVLYIGLFIGIIIDAATTGVPLVTGIFGLLLTVFGLGILVFTVIAAIKGYGGEMYKVPVVGNFAEKYA